MEVPKKTGSKCGVQVGWWRMVLKDIKSKKEKKMREGQTGK